MIPCNSSVIIFWNYDVKIEENEYSQVVIYGFDSLHSDQALHKNIIFSKNFVKIFTAQSLEGSVCC